MRLPVLLFSLLWIVVGGVSSQSNLPRLNPADCSELGQQFAEAQPQRLACWRLIVPWFRAGRESSRQMELFTLRLKSLVKSGQAPILYLPGGPGEAASHSLREWLASDLSQDHDIILLDARGAGFSRPTLHCREARPRGQADWMRVCRERFAASELDLSAFALSEVMRDYVDLLSVLGDAQVNVYGHSFGSRLALMLADAAPGRIRALVLDGVYPPPVYDLAELARNLDAALDQLFADCAQDSACGRAFPNLDDLFYRTAAELNATPQTVIMPGLDIGLSLNGSDYIFLLWSWLHDAGAIPYLPAFIASLARGAYEVDPLLESALLARSDDPRIRRNESAFLSVRCPGDLAARAAEPSPAAEADIHPLLLAAVRELVADHYAKCQSWNVPMAVSRLRDPVASDIPSLLFSGAYDPATPPRWGDFALAHLSNAWHFVFPQAGHGALAAAPCATNIMRAFLEDATRAPAADCFAAQAPPVFLTPE